MSVRRRFVTNVAGGESARRRPWRLRAAALTLAALGSVGAQAESPPVQGVVNLAASASTEVAKDWISVTLGTQREGSDAAPVQTALKQALDAALQEARKVAKPGQVDVQTGSFNLSPRYTAKGQTNGWQGSAELIVEGKDMAAIAQLTGRITSLSISRVAYGLSREQREKAEAAVTGDAVSRFRARASEVARLFGYASHTVREVSVSSNEQAPFVPMVRAKAMAMASSADEALPVEAGKATVTVTVSGSVQMLK